MRIVESAAPVSSLTVCQRMVVLLIHLNGSVQAVGPPNPSFQIVAVSELW